MKTAEEWSTDIANQNLERKPMVWPSDHLLLVRDIQLDAIKYGMTLALGYVTSRSDTEKILRARDSECFKS